MKKLSQLSQLEKRILAAESIGWEVPRSPEGHIYTAYDFVTRESDAPCGYPPPDKSGRRYTDYFLTVPLVDSLDAIRGYEKTLAENECYIYEGAIAKLQDSSDTGGFSQKCIFASAEQRLDAYLVAKGLAILG